MNEMKKGFTPLEVHLVRSTLSRRDNYIAQRKPLTGFTLIEALVGISIIIILSLLTVPALRVFQARSDLANSAEEMMTIFRTAQSKAKASEGNTPWGVYVDSSAQQYTLFQGSSYATRNTAQDKLTKLASKVEFSSISFGGGNETVFQKVTGFPVPAGTIALWLASDHSQTTTVSLSSSGVVMIGIFGVVSDTNRVKDSRHVHVDYVGRAINTATESVRLVFFGITQTIPIASNLQGGVFSWEGDVTVQGEAQHIKIATHLLNDSVLATQFSVHRDKRYNTKTLTIELSGDATGNILLYDAVGQTTKGTSLYASTPSWQ